VLVNIGYRFALIIKTAKDFNLGSIYLISAIKPPFSDFAAR
jgi:hypothetical protein